MIDDNILNSLTSEFLDPPEPDDGPCRNPVPGTSHWRRLRPWRPCLSPTDTTFFRWRFIDFLLGKRNTSLIFFKPCPSPFICKGRFSC